MGLRVRGQFQDLLPANKVVQNGGISYVDLSAFNTRNIVGFYEAVARFKVSQFNHDRTPIAKLKDGSSDKAKPSYSNSSSLLMVEAGYQYNTGLQQLAQNQQTNTKQRFVGRVYLTPEIPNTNHTRPLIGFEYSSGLNGGPKVVQIFFGMNVNALKLFTNPTTNKSGN